MSEKGETLTIDPAGAVVNTECPCHPKLFSPDRDDENKKDLGKKPPHRGLCRRCGLDKPINRLMLCYRCWVITEIENREKKEGREWHEGEPHPDWCRCDGLGEHKTGDGAFRGNN